MSFSPVRPEDYTRLRPYFLNQCHPLCVYSLPAIISWRTSRYEPRCREQNGALLVKAHFVDPGKKPHLLLPIAGGRVFSPEALHELTLETGVDTFGFVPEAYIAREGRYQVERWFRIHHQPELDDYIYKAKDLAELKGNRYAKKRNLIHQFKRLFLDAGRVAMEKMSRENADECLEFLDEWCRERDCGRNAETDLACERQACTRMIEGIDRFDAQGLVLRVDAKVSAFGIGGRLTRDMGVLHFEKADAGVKGLYQYLDQVCSAAFFRNLEWINKESDMGEEGLAHAKKSYHPVKKEKAYRLVAR